MTLFDVYVCIIILSELLADHAWHIQKKRYTGWQLTWEFVLFAFKFE